MSKLLGILGAVAAIIGALFMLSMFWGHANNGGMAVLGLQMLGVFTSLLGIVLGGIAMFTNRPERTTPGEIGFGLGLGSLLALLIAMLLFG